MLNYQRVPCPRNPFNDFFCTGSACAALSQGQTKSLLQSMLRAAAVPGCPCGIEAVWACLPSRSSGGPELDAVFTQEKLKTTNFNKLYS